MNSYSVRGIPETYSYSEYTTYKAMSITKLGFQNSQNFTIEVDSCNRRAFGSYSVFINNVNVNKAWLLKISRKKQKQKKDKQKTEMEIHSPKTPC